SLILSPLTPYMTPNGKTYTYYDCHAPLATTAQQLKTIVPKILVVVDGPPGSTGKNARYPALPAVLEHFRTAHIDMILDDYMRDDEKSVVSMWMADLERSALPTKIEEKQMEKGSCFISINS